MENKANSAINILLLDDDKDMREMYSQMLEQHFPNCRVTPASNAAQVVDEVAKIRGEGKHYHLVITDYSVLKLITDNLTVEQSIIGLLETSIKKPPILLFSAKDLMCIYAERPIIQQYVTSYIRKQAEMNEFLTAVNRLLTAYMGHPIN